MVETWGEVLRSMRTAAELSLAALAQRVHVSKALIGHLETGARRPTGDIAQALDAALRGGGVLVDLAAAEQDGDDMRRRALLATVTAAAGVGALAGPHALGDMVRHGLLDAAGTTHDWDQVVDDAQRRLVADPSPLLGAALLTQLARLRNQLARDAAPSLLRAAAQLGQVYGLWLGNCAQLGGAHQWYRSATQLADRSGDTATRVYVRGRSAARGIYEGWTVRQTLDTAAAALQLTDRPTAGAVEAHAARVHVHALTGDIERGRAAVQAMADVADRLPGEAAASRTLFLRAFLECRAGDYATALVACDEAEPALRGWPMWLAETRVYRARAMVAAGDVREGLAAAVQTATSMRHDVRVISVAVRDVVAAVPAGHRSDELDALAPYADPTPGPWETLR